MGKRARQRRRADPTGSRADRRRRGPHEADPVRSRERLRRRLEAVGEEVSHDPDALLVAVGSLAVEAGGQRLASVADELLRDALGEAWRRGWQPADVERVVRRRLEPDAASVLLGALADERSTHADADVDPAWDDQLAGVGAQMGWPVDGTHLGWWAGQRTWPVERAVVVALHLLDLVLALPGLPVIAPPPGTAGAGARRGRAAAAGDPAAVRDLARVRALLAKAESTTFDGEREALAAKAQELLARHSLDRSMLDAAHGVAAEAAGRRLAVDDPYAGAKALLLQHVAEANRCRSVWSSSFGFAAVHGLPGDLAAVDLLFTSLLVQADRALAAAGRHVDARGRSRTRSFRQAFLLGFAGRVGARLREGASTARVDAEAEHGAALVPVLAAADAAVEAAFRRANPGMVTRPVRSSNPAGYVAGIAAGEAASLHRGPALRR